MWSATPAPPACEEVGKAHVQAQGVEAPPGRLSPPFKFLSIMVGKDNITAAMPSLWTFMFEDMMLIHTLGRPSDRGRSSEQSSSSPPCWPANSPVFWGFWHQMIKTTLMTSESWPRSWGWSLTRCLRVCWFSDTGESLGEHEPFGEEESRGDSPPSFICW